MTPKKTYLDVCFCPEQNEKGIVTPSTSVVSRSISNTTYFSDRFNCKVQSDARVKINDLRENVFAPIIDDLNETIPDGTKPYMMERTKTIGTPEFGKLAHVLRLVFDSSSASPEDFVPESNDKYENIPFFTKTPVEDVIDLGVRRITYGKKNPESWPRVNWGELKPRKKKFTPKKTFNTMSDIWPVEKTGTDN